MEVCDYLAAHYQLESIKELYISGDGARWIRIGQEYLPGSTFILDRFHLSRAILKATAHVPALKRRLYQELRALNQPGVLEPLYQALNQAEGKARKKRIHQTIGYIKNNWDGIEAGIKHPHIGCSAEGYVSHILSARLSSRPMAWSIQGAEKMASMRALQADGESIGEHYLASRAKKPSPIGELKEEAKHVLGRLRSKKPIGKEKIANVPVFHNISSYTRMALKALNERTVL